VTTANWIIFSFVMPAVVAAIGWLGAVAYERQLRREDERERRADTPAE
jgi:hypothetical protein